MRTTNIRNRKDLKALLKWIWKMKKITKFLSFYRKPYQSNWQTSELVICFGEVPKM